MVEKRVALDKLTALRNLVDAYLSYVKNVVAEDDKLLDEEFDAIAQDFQEQCKEILPPPPQQPSQAKK